MDNILKKIHLELEKNSDLKTKKSGERFFKEDVKLLGVKSAEVRQIAKDFFKDIKDRKKSEIFALCEDLWRSGYLEESFVACHWSYFVRKDYEPRDFKVFEKWVNQYVRNWAACDTFCNHTVGAYVEMYPDCLAGLKKWARSKNLWTRRAAAVSLIIPARRGKFLKDIFEIVSILMRDKEDIVQKGYGWMLKVASQARQKEVFSFVMKNKAKMPRTALRYAIEKMSKVLKEKAMVK